MDIAELDTYLNPSYKEYASKYVKSVDGGKQVESINDVDLNYFSETVLSK